jgi:hypothetical protein
MKMDVKGSHFIVPFYAAFIALSVSYFLWWKSLPPDLVHGHIGIWVSEIGCESSTCEGICETYIDHAMAEVITDRDLQSPHTTY